MGHPPCEGTFLGNLVDFCWNPLSKSKEKFSLPFKMWFICRVSSCFCCVGSFELSFFVAKISDHDQGGRFNGGRWGDRSCPRKLYWNILRSSVLRGAWKGVEKVERVDGFFIIVGNDSEMISVMTDSIH